MNNYLAISWAFRVLVITCVGVEAGTSDGRVTGDIVVREAQEAATATRDFTIQQKDTFQRKIQTELQEAQVRITHLREQVKHASGEARADILKSIGELEKGKSLVSKNVEAIHSATVSSWEQVKSKMAVAMDDLRASLKRALSHLQSR